MDPREGARQRFFDLDRKFCDPGFSGRAIFGEIFRISKHLLKIQEKSAKMSKNEGSPRGGGVFGARSAPKKTLIWGNIN